MEDGTSLQRAYYQRTANEYDHVHRHSDAQISAALEHIAGLVPRLGIRSLLDTGCGTGRGLRFLRERFPALALRGNDPSQELLSVATKRYGIPAELLIHSDTLSLPTNETYDAVMALAVLHHVPDPDALVRRMLRLARTAVFIADANYLGQGPPALRRVKYALTKLGVWRALKYVQQGFKPYAYDDTDGIFYSYTAFSALPILQRRCREVYVIGVSGDPARTYRSPMFEAPDVLVCGLKC